MQSVEQDVNIKTYEPASSAEAAEILREANASGTFVGLGGGSTKQDYGNLPKPVGLKISTNRLNELIAYQPEDLTITIGAGMEFDRLQEILAENGQWLPLDPPHLRGATVGGIMGTNVSGPKRLLYGTARDLLIGCEFVLADGNIGRSGGRVVKNVTGYDLHKLMIGSLGTLGFLTEVTFKVLPLPQYSEWGNIVFEKSESALRAAREIARSNTSPAALEVFNVANGYSLYFAAEGVEVAVKDQISGIVELCRKVEAWSVAEPATVATGDYTKLWQKFRDYANQAQYNLQLKWSDTLTNLSHTLTRVEGFAQQAGLEATLQVRAGTGIIYLYATLAENQAAQTVQLIETARQEIQAKGGSLVIEKAPADLKEKIEVFGEVGDAFAPMKALKDKLDPKGILNPGRFVKGI